VDAAGLELHRRDRRRGAADEGERLSLAGPELLGDRLNPVGDVDDVGVAGGRDRELFAANGDALTVAEGCASFGPMRALVQRVSQAAVDVEGERIAQIGPGMLVLLGVGVGDGEEQADRLADKVRALRIFDDAEGRMNEALGDREVLCVSQFTLYGDARRGNRPSYTDAARPEAAEPLYERFCERLGAARGVFGACMGVALVNDGPVTMMLEVSSGRSAP
jgi:D-tyrosyl-tRNA(Tyr) deacylase